MRTPKIENKYNLTVSKIKKLKVLDNEKIKGKPFWRNNVVKAWCLSGTIRPYPKDSYGTYDEDFWYGIYDDGKVRFHCTSYGGMCGYKFDKFYKEKDIETETDLMLQELILETFNGLIDNGILSLE